MDSSDAILVFHNIFYLLSFTKPRFRQSFCQFIFSDETMSYEAYNWRGLVDKTNHSKVIHCTNTQEPTGIYINIEGSKEEILQANTGKSSGRFRFVVYD